MLNGDGAHREARMTRDEALRYARALLEQHPVDPALMEELRKIISGNEALILWLASNNAWFRGDCPLQHLNERDTVLDAARKAISLDHLWGSDNESGAYQQQVGK